MQPDRTEPGDDARVCRDDPDIGEEVFRSGKWRKIVSGFSEVGGLLLVVAEHDAPGLAACALGQIDERLPGPGDPTGRRGYIYNVATLASHRRRGYSRACMTALIDWYAHRGIRAVDLRASRDGEPLYTSLGFRRTPDPAMRLIVNRPA